MATAQLSRLGAAIPMSLKRAVPPIAILVLIVIVVLAIGYLSTSFNSCLNDPNYNTNVIRKLFVCSGEFVENNGEAITAIFTVVLAISTTFLWHSTSQLWEAGEKQLRIAAKTAEAAQKTANAAMAVETARLFVDMKAENLNEITTTAWRWEKTLSVDNDLVKFPFCQYIFKNYGKTPALIKEYSVGQFVCQKNRPDDLVYKYSVIKLPRYMLRADEETQVLTSKCEILTIKDCKKIARGELTLWFYISVTFDDVFGREVGQRFLWSFNGNRPFQPYV